MNFKRNKPKRYSKVFRGGTDGPDCGWCGSNWTWEQYVKRHLIQWENEDEPKECGCNTDDDFTCPEHQAYHEEMEEWMNA